MLIFMESTDSSVVPDERYCLLYNFMNSLLDNFENKDNDDYGLWISKTADFVVNFNKLILIYR